HHYLNSFPTRRSSDLERLIQVNGNGSAKVQISGFIGQAGLSRQSRAQQLIFVNGRAIESGLISAAIREGYHTALMKGQYPVTFRSEEHTSELQSRGHL